MRSHTGRNPAPILRSTPGSSTYDRVIDHHIDFFVNSYSLSLGDEGRRAVRELTGVEV